MGVFCCAVSGASIFEEMPATPSVVQRFRMLHCTPEHLCAVAEGGASMIAHRKNKRVHGDRERNHPMFVASYERDSIKDACRHGPINDTYCLGDGGSSFKALQVVTAQQTKARNCPQGKFLLIAGTCGFQFLTCFLFLLEPVSVT